MHAFKFNSAEQNQYAWKIYSDEGQHDGLYWKAADGQPQSPIGPLVAAAFLDSTVSNQATASTPFRGYYFRLLIRQEKTSSGGKNADGFAFVAYPAEYRSSGVMTFMVNEGGVIYERDLGKKTEEVAKSIKEFKLNFLMANG